VHHISPNLYYCASWVPKLSKCIFGSLNRLKGSISGPKHATRAPSADVACHHGINMQKSPPHSASSLSLSLLLPLSSSPISLFSLSGLRHFGLEPSVSISFNGVLFPFLKLAIDFSTKSLNYRSFFAGNGASYA
jgi:hypothetical protein